MHNLDKLAQNKAWEALKELQAHPGFEVLREQVLQDQYDPQGARVRTSLLRQERSKLEREIRAGDLPAIKYCQGRIDMLMEVMEGKVIDDVLKEFTQ